MLRRARPAVFLLPALLAFVLTAFQRAEEKAAPADPPHDLIVALDVSDSMLWGARDGQGNDPEGFRWDGLQFLIDTARGDDRLALVLFMGDAAVPTQQPFLGDRSGFIQMNQDYYHPGLKRKVKGRRLLKDLIDDLRQREEKWVKKFREQIRKSKNPDKEQPSSAFFLFDDLPSLGGKKFALHYYTSVVETLNTITHKAKLLDQLRGEAQPWLLLFTDGEETVVPKDLDFKAEDHQFPADRADYDYLKKLKTDAGRSEVLEKHLAPMRKQQVRAFTFALGDECDEKLLRAITDGTNQQAGKAVRDRIGAYYNPRTNVKLLQDLQQVCWELRQYWVLTPQAEPLTGQQRFQLPEPGPWLDLGVMLYRQPARAGGLARAPGAEAVTFTQASAVKGPAALASRSHLYYRFDEGDHKLAANEALKVNVKRGESEPACICIGAVRTRQPLFHYQQPAAGSVFTPLDAIPLEVEFRPYMVDDRFPFTANQFEVSAVLLPVGGKDRKPLSVVLEADRAAAGKPVLFRGEVVLDRAPTAYNESLLGRYEVEMTIRGKSGPLAGAKRHLIRVPIEVKDYPDLKVTPEQVRLSNKDDALQAEVQVEVPAVRLGKEDNRVVARIGASLGGTWKKAGSAGTLAATKAVLSPRTAELRGGKGTVKVSLAATALSGLAVGEYKGATLKLSTPWGREHKLDLSLERVAWELAPLEPLVFDFSRRRDSHLTRDLAVRLRAVAAAREEVWLSTQPTAEPSRDSKVVFKGPGGKMVTLQARGLGRPLAVNRAGPLEKDKKLSLTLVRGDDLPLGECTATLYLVGAAIKPVAVPVSVRRQQFEVQAPAEVVLDLSDSKADKVTGRLPVTLKTDLDTDEEVWLSERDNGEPAGKDQELPFQSRDAGEIKLGLVGLGKRTAVKGLSARDTINLEVALRRPAKKPASGWYERKLYLVGEAIKSQALTIKVKVDQPVVFLVDRDGKPLRRLDELSLVGLAGRDLPPCAVMVRTELEQNSSPAVYDLLASKLNAGLEKLRHAAGDDLALDFQSGKDRLWVKFKVPSQVQPGDYRAQLALDLSAQKGPPLLLQLPVLVQVLHFAVGPREQGTLQLQLGQGPDMRVTRPIQLTTEAKRGQVVRWSVERVPLARRGLVQPLEVKRLDVLYNEASVVKEKDHPASPSTPLVPGQKCELTVAVDCAGLAPGRYHAGLRFRSSANDQPLLVEGLSRDLNVEVLVPGRELQAAPAEGVRARVGAAVPVRVAVTAHGCDLGRGQVRALDDRGKVLGPVLTIDDKNKIKDAADPQDPAVRRGEFVVSVTPHQAGPNSFLVSWQRHFPSNDKEGPTAPGAAKTEMAQVVSVMADGQIEVVPAVGYVGEEVAVRAIVAPSLRQGAGGLTLRATHPDLEPENVELRERNGPGLYSGALRLRVPGEYRLSLPGKRPWQLAEAKARAGFTLDHPVQEGEMRYGGGWMMEVLLVWDRSLERVAMRDVVRLQNKEAAECHWQACLRYPRQEHESQRIIEGRDLDTVKVGDFDGALHLDSYLVLQSNTGTTEDSDGELGGVLKNGQSIELGLISSLSEDAKDHLFKNRAGEHPTLGKANGMLIEVKLNWFDAEGKPVGQRTVLLPVTVKTSHWGWRGVATILFWLAALVVGYLGWRRLRRWWVASAARRAAREGSDVAVSRGDWSKPREDRQVQEPTRAQEEPTRGRGGESDVPLRGDFT